MPLAGLVIVNLEIFAATRSLRSLLVACFITSALAWLLVFGAAGIMNALDAISTGSD